MDTAHRLRLELERLQAQGVMSHAGLAAVLTESGILTLRGGTVWTHTTVARVLTKTT